MERYRHELKFVCSKEQALIVESRIRGIMVIDKHSECDGTYNVRSVYFDDMENNCYKENENGVDPRQKYRIRTYNTSRDIITLEKKIKYCGMTKKIVCRLSLCEYEYLVNDASKYIIAHNSSKLLNEFIIRRIETYHPVIIINYTRKAYTYNIGNVRVTFDYNVSFSDRIKDFFEERLSFIPILDNEKVILEIKYDELIPYFLLQTINDGHLIRSNFSKYYMACKSLGGRF